MRLITGVYTIALGALVSGCAPEPPPFAEVADVKILMSAVLEPAAEVYWDAVGWVLDTNGTTAIAPTSPEEWEAVRNAAYIVAESGNLLMMEGRAPDRGKWMSMSRAMVEAGRRALAAADKKDALAVFDAGADIYYACSDCHATYASQTLRPSHEPGK